MKKNKNRAFLMLVMILGSMELSMGQGNTDALSIIPKQLITASPDSIYESQVRIVIPDSLSPNAIRLIVMDSTFIEMDSVFILQEISLNNTSSTWRSGNEFYLEATMYNPFKRKIYIVELLSATQVLLLQIEKEL